MPSPAGPTRLLLALSCAWLASACASKGPPLTAYPPPADLAVPSKPQLAPEALGSAVALAEHNSRIEAWGDGLALQIGRLCRWAEDMGAKGVRCPAS